LQDNAKARELSGTGHAVGKIAIYVGQPGPLVEEHEKDRVRFQALKVLFK